MAAPAPKQGEQAEVAPPSVDEQVEQISSFETLLHELESMTHTVSEELSHSLKAEQLERGYNIHIADALDAYCAAEYETEITDALKTVAANFRSCATISEQNEANYLSVIQRLKSFKEMARPSKDMVHEVGKISHKYVATKKKMDNSTKAAAKAKMAPQIDELGTKITYREPEFQSTRADFDKLRLEQTKKVMMDLLHTRIKGHSLVLNQLTDAYRAVHEMEVNPSEFLVSGPTVATTATGAGGPVGRQGGASTASRQGSGGGASTASRQGGAATASQLVSRR